MNRELVNFRITSLTARVPSGVALEWRGKNSSPGLWSLSSTGTPPRLGIEVYWIILGAGRATFQVLFSFPQFTHTLKELRSILSLFVRYERHSIQKGKLARTTAS
jgi:hypothetical protein